MRFGTIVIKLSVMRRPFQNKTILKILDYYKNLWALGYVSNIAHWDLETYMPEKGASARGEALGRLSVIRQKMFLDKDFVSLIHQAERSQTLSEVERGIVRVLLHSLRFYEKLPPDFIEEFEKLTNTATVVWRSAKEKNNFKLFEPYLTKIFDMNRKAADYLGYKDSPYDALLDQFEERLTSREAESFFGEIRDPLKNLLSKILKSNKHNNSHFLERAGYNQEKLASLNQKILALFWEDFSRFRLDVSRHPFTTSFSGNDTRITTWYHKTDFARSILATIHEFGHALYDLQSAPELEMTPIAGGSSLVIHESQSRFWENFIGRSDSFLRRYLVDFKGLSPEINRYIQREKIDSLRMYFNRVSPGPLRVEADEVTYHFHIMLRFEIEKGIIEGRMKVRDLPEIWRTKMLEYLEIAPQSESEGALQDIHWSGGMVGYFPTYSLGTFLGAQWEEKISQISKLKSQSYISNLKSVEIWLGEHIHKYGSTYTLSDLLKKNGMKFDPSVNLNYLKEKYSKIYGF